jgi:hypothetical protein
MVYVPETEFEAYLDRIYYLLYVTTRVVSVGMEEEFLIKDGVLLSYQGAGGNVVIPDGVKEIGRYAFHGCDEVTAVTIPEGVTVIGEYAFYYCTRMERIELPASLKQIDKYAFGNCDALTGTLQIPDGLSIIGDYAFFGLTGLKEVRFGNNLENVGNYAFADCANILQDVVLPGTMKTIGTQAFFKTGITGVKTGGTTSIGGQAFAACMYMVYAEFPNVNTVTAGGLFEGCSSLVSVDMPEISSVTGHGMFSYCTSLREVYLGSRVSGFTLGTGTFINMSSAQVKMYVPEDLLTLYSDGKILHAKQVYPRGE